MKERRYIRGAERHWFRQSSASSFKNIHTTSSHPPSLIQTLLPRCLHCSPLDTHREPPSQKLQTMCSNSIFTYSQASNGSQATDLGSSSASTGRQLGSRTSTHDSAPASQQMARGSQATTPNTHDTIHLSQDRMNTLRRQSGGSSQSTPDVNMIVVIRANTANLEAQC